MAKNILKLKFWNPDIPDALPAAKTAYTEWKETNPPMDINNPLLQKKKTTRKIFRNSLRNGYICVENTKRGMI